MLLRPTGEPPSAIPGLGRMGLAVFLASLTVLFAASVVAYVVVRSRAERWPPAGAPPLPGVLWVSTGLLVACSAAIEIARRGVAAGRLERLRRGLLSALVLALVFVGAQAWGWLQFFHAATFGAHLYGFTFYMLTGLHAAHVLGGIVALAVVGCRAYRGDYTWARYPGVTHAAVYWHYLGVVWLALFALLLAGA